MSLLLATAAVVLTPVALDDPQLEHEGTFISATAQAARSDGSVDELLCLALPADHPEGTRACLTAAEWQAVFDRVAHDESIRWRERAMHIAHWYSGASD
ncbi:hypothetical protein OZN62_01485 [Aurantiacibacter sp. MUD11]|uniref:hypothetical protein n=1 Tax=Aurantiacibacter sp. MUD11 TaxID=3003265 RepID=UPI0022AA793F|nr:hypothetical protein [Aurantiacibacter sp. MUD11]WAT18275.1 hypothetical protein OZN62_01485 [Aurantiacibacter sp. MUD11]